MVSVQRHRNHLRGTACTSWSFVVAGVEQKDYPARGYCAPPLFDLLRGVLALGQMNQKQPSFHNSEPGWIAPRARDEMDCVRLFCFPYAGVGISVYRDWSKQLPGVDVCLVQPPGRGARIRETAIIGFEEHVSRVTEGILPYVDELPYAFYGHSLGAVMAFESARRLRRVAGVGEPVHLIVGARRGPRLASRFPPMARLSDAELIFALEDRFGQGIPQEVAEEPELLARLLPALRADVVANEEYVYVNEEPLSCAVTALSGVDDPSVSLDEVQAWNVETRGPFACALLQGGHFFAKDASPQLLRVIARALGTDTPRPRPSTDDR